MLTCYAWRLLLPHLYRITQILEFVNNTGNKFLPFSKFLKYSQTRDIISSPKIRNLTKEHVVMKKLVIRWPWYSQLPPSAVENESDHTLDCEVSLAEGETKVYIGVGGEKELLFAIKGGESYNGTITLDDKLWFIWVTRWIRGRPTSNCHFCIEMGQLPQAFWSNG